MLSMDPRILGAGPSTGVTPPIPTLGLAASAPDIGEGFTPTTILSNH